MKKTMRFVKRPLTKRRVYEQSIIVNTANEYGIWGIKAYMKYIKRKVALSGMSLFFFMLFENVHINKSKVIKEKRHDKQLT